jgi:hypothetical protein
MVVSVEEKSRQRIVAGGGQGDERKRTIRWGVETLKTMSKPGYYYGPGTRAEGTCLLTVRHPA